jgi:hypothetical protein
LAKTNSNLPSTGGIELLLGDVRDVDTDHGLSEILRDLSEDLGVVVVSNGLDNGTGTLGWVARLEDTGTNKDTVASELHHQGSIGRGGNTTSSKVDNGKTSQLGSLLEQVVRSLDLLGIGEELIVIHQLSLADLRLDSAAVTDSLDNVTGTGLTLGADHGSTLVDATKSLTEVLAAADEGDLVVVLVDMVGVIGRGQDLRLVNVINSEGLDDLYS